MWLEGWCSEMHKAEYEEKQWKWRFKEVKIN
jgi:hypothetical protein